MSSRRRAAALVLLGLSVILGGYLVIGMAVWGVERGLAATAVAVVLNATGLVLLLRQDRAARQGR